MYKINFSAKPLIGAQVQVNDLPERCSQMIFNLDSDFIQASFLI
jgi:hypothetical protein